MLSMSAPIIEPTTVPDAAGKAGATDHDGGDGVELVAAAVDVAALVDQRGVEQRGEPGQQPGEHEDDDLDAVDVDARRAAPPSRCRQRRRRGGRSRCGATGSEAIKPTPRK